MDRIIVYRNPVEAKFYESGMNNFLLLCVAIGCVCFIILEFIVFHTKNSKFKFLRKINDYKGHIWLLSTLVISAYAYYVIYW